jgi:hypothetical protein
MVIKVDFDLTMSILAHNLLRLFAADLDGYTHCANFTLYKKFLSMGGSVEVKADKIIVRIKKKRHLPALLTAMEPYQDTPLRFMGNLKLIFVGDSSS